MYKFTGKNWLELVDCFGVAIRENDVLDYERTKKRLAGYILDYSVRLEVYENCKKFIRAYSVQADPRERLVYRALLDLKDRAVFGRFFSRMFTLFWL